LKTKNITFQFREFPFSLDNGFDQLKKIFASIIIERFDNSLKSNEVEPIINYYLSLNGLHNNFIILSDENVEDFRKYLNNIITNKQVISVTKDEGIFICKK